MNTQYFPHFIRKNYDIGHQLTNEECVEVGEGFKAYLQDKFKGNEAMLEKIWNIDPQKVIMDSDHPLKVNGYEPALIIHFGNFIEASKA